MSSAVSMVDYTGDGSTLLFAVPFKFIENSHLVVTLGGALQALTADYTVDGAGEDAGGHVTFVDAPPAASAIHIERTVPVVQLTPFRTQGSFSPQVHEDALDYRTMVDQQLFRQASDLEDSLAPVCAGLVHYGPDVELDPGVTSPATVALTTSHTTTLAFATAVLNAGAVFDNPARFVATSAGDYQLHAQVALQREASPSDEEWVSVSLVKNGSTELARAVARLEGDDRWFTPSLAVVAHLSLNDYVEVKVRLFDCAFTLYGGAYSSFGGYLARAD